MNWLEEIITEYEHLNPLKERINQIKGLENYNDVIDISKALIETILRTILDERKIEYKSEDDLKKLLNHFLSNITYFDEVEGNVVTKLRAGLSTILDSIKEIRNDKGEISHGKSIYHLQTKKELARFIFENSCSFCGFIWSVHRNYDLDKLELKYEENQTFNDWIDDSKEEIVLKFKEIEYTFMPSRVLFLDSEAYKQVLWDFKSEKKYLIEKLDNSTNFANTHETIAELEKQKSKLELEDVCELIKIANENSQVEWILSDKDVFDFYSDILNGIEETELIVDFKKKLEENKPEK